MAPRSRSSTLSSVHSTKLPSSPATATNPLSDSPTSSPVQPFHPSQLSATDDDDDAFAPQSYRSEHSLKTIRASQRGGAGEGGSSDDDEPLGRGGAGGGGEGAAEQYGEGPASLPGRRTGPQFVIDLPSSSSSPGPGDSPLLGTRGRSDTFGGVPLPPSHLSNTNAFTHHATAHSEDDELPHPATSSRPQRPGMGRARSSSLTSLSALDPALHLGGAPLRERRPVLYAGLQAGSLLVVSVLGLWILLKTLLPPIDEEHKVAVKLPKSFEDLKQLNEVLQVYRARNNWRVLSCYALVYLFLQAFSIPGSMYLSILGGALWGVLIALPLVCFCVATGALLCYMMSAALGPAVLLHSQTWQNRVDQWTARVMEHKSNLVSYLIVLRIAPLPPHWVVNVVAPHLGIPIWTFWLSTFIGIAGVSYIHTQIGTTLDSMTSSEDFHLISLKNGLGLCGIILAVLVPVLLRRYFASDIAAAAATDSSNPEPTEPLLHPRASLSLDDDTYDDTLASNVRRSAEQQRYADDGGDGEERGVEGSGGLRVGGRPVLKEGGGSANKVSRVLGVQVGGHAGGL